MSRVRRLRIPITPLLRRVRLPLFNRSMPLWALLALATPIMLFAGGAGMVYTNQPIFCKSCHEMSLHYATWSQSAHHGVGCEQCHVMPGMANMLKSKFNALRLVKRHAAGDVTATAIQGHVPDQNCKQCHTETPALVTYHGLKITHKAHWDMGAKCTFCHDRVVHGPKWLYTGVTSNERVAAVSTAYKYTPTMEKCYTCHDGKRAPNECSTCHVSLGERKPTAFDPAWVEAHREEVHRTGEENCERCHLSDFCQNCHRAANPHPSDWVARHPAEVKKSPEGCPKCHLAPAEKKPQDVKQMAFCSACHGLRQEHKQADWQQIHGKEALSTPASCQRCHTTSWCAACHSISKPHPPEWLARHSAEATRDPHNCQTCHTQQFCDSCHQSKKSIPASHQKDWMTRHQESARRPGSDCKTCHTANFCQKCHSQRPPASHDKMWLDEHGVASRSGDASCHLCHEQSFCNKCHGLQMPHPKDWVIKHRETAAYDRSQCVKCHQADGCSACHKGALPASHKSDTWVEQHGGQALQSKTTCTVCHRPQFCNSCHGMEMPHPKDWRTNGHPKAAKSNQDACLHCHRQDECTKCHGVQVPHPEGFVSGHGKQAVAAPQKCAQCHREKHNECTACHSFIQPASHKASDWKTTHAVAGANAMDLCTLCHGKDACNSCHAANAKATSK